MKSSGIFFYTGHGAPTFVDCGGGSSLTRDYVLSQPAGSLSDCRLVVYLTCEAGKGGIDGANLAQATVDRGATTVIAFREKIGVIQSDTWMEEFCNALASGKTVNEAGKEADKYTSEKYDGKIAFTDTWLPFGTRDQQFR